MQRAMGVARLMGPTTRPAVISNARSHASAFASLSTSCSSSAPAVTRAAQFLGDGARTSTAALDQVPWYAGSVGTRSFGVASAAVGAVALLRMAKPTRHGARVGSRCYAALARPAMPTATMDVTCESEDAVNAVAENLQSIRAKMDASMTDRASGVVSGNAPPPVRLVAVSKTKPVEALRAAYDAGHRHFGENYVAELLEKVPKMPKDVQWHFIGHLQSNKAGQLVKGCPSLACVETVDTEKLARLLNKAAGALEPPRRLRVMVQVNSSGEQSKHGVDPEACEALCQYIATDCKNLELAGLMTIGAPDYSGCRAEDFETMKSCRSKVAAAIGVESSVLELSMGMSNDFELAIQEGSTSVRVGSSIFGARDYPAKRG